jgi:RNA polymerase sigma factor (sigma-70 family)
MSLDLDLTHDRDLMDRVRRGDLGAESELYRLHAAVALRRAIQLGAQPADAEDFVHEAFVRVIRALRKGSGPEEVFRPYLIAAIRNVAADAHRGQRGRETPSTDALPRYEASVTTRDPQHEIEMRLQVQAAMRGLPQRWKDILWRLDVEGETPSSIAGASGVSPQSISALAYRARRAFRQAYRAGDELPSAS